MRAGEEDGTIRLPVRRCNAEGRERGVGVEMELGGMSLAAITERVRGSVGGRIVEEDEYRARVEETTIGTVRIEFDARLFSEMKLKGFLGHLPWSGGSGGDLAGSIERLLASAAAHLVPFELVFAPLPMSRLGELEAVRVGLRGVAEGTGVSVWKAFGMHFNPEVPDLGADTALRYLRAFLCLADKLREWHEVDPTRALSPFIDPFPAEYASLALESGYRPDWVGFSGDYVRFNPTRNRPLDFLPLLAHVDEEAVRRVLPDEKINSRPTFHYRLPNSRIDEEDWTIASEWNGWVAVEELASDEEALTEACRRERRRLRGS